MARILVIDDEDFVRFTIDRILRAAGHAVALAEDGAVGCRLQREAPFDAVICDILMPNQEGIETIRRLRADYPALPIVAMSGGGRSGTQDFLAMALHLGASGTIAKPFLPDELLTAVAGAVRGRPG